MDTPAGAPRFFPVGIDLRGKPCLIVGGGNVGTRKATTLVHAGAEVTVVAPQVTDELAGLISENSLRWIQDVFRQEHLPGVFLAVAATDDDDTNAAVIRAALENHALACDASSAERSQLIFGAMLERDDVTIAVFTDGRDPATARRTRDQLADLISQDHKSKPHES
jgi:precorrin-2 dehydrogenase/sirohydrochlorin ferrochelatase